jgi:protein-disulfide isomerase
MTQLLRMMAAALVLLLAGAASAQDVEWAKGPLTMGEDDAPVKIIEYASMTCPHCAHFALQTFDKLKEKYIDTGKVHYEFREFPFDGLALRASMLARCAGPTRALPMIDVLFKQQAVWAGSKSPMEELVKLGKLGGVSEARFNACMEDQALADAILANRLHGEKEMKVDSTPTFFINGEKMTGSQPIEKFDEVLAKHLP